MRVAPTAPFPPREICSSEELGNLCDVLDRIHVNREVLVAVSNKNIFHMLGMYIEASARADFFGWRASFCLQPGTQTIPEQDQSMHDEYDGHHLRGIEQFVFYQEEARAICGQRV